MINKSKNLHYQSLNYKTILISNFLWNLLFTAKIENEKYIISSVYIYRLYISQLKFGNFIFTYKTVYFKRNQFTSAKFTINIM